MNNTLSHLLSKTELSFNVETFPDDTESKSGVNVRRCKNILLVKSYFRTKYFRNLQFCLSGLFVVIMHQEI